MGYETWRTRNSRDDGLDAVAVLGDRPPQRPAPGSDRRPQPEGPAPRTPRHRRPDRAPKDPARPAAE
nr:hypothetical protein [Kitasatospora phosalacinea]